MEPLENKTILITGGTGSLGKVLTRRILSNELGTPKKVIIYSRDEAKQHFMRLEYQHKRRSTDEIIYHNFERILEFRIGDVRDHNALASVLMGVDLVINAAALKQVPSCEYFPFEAVQTNIIGAQNIVNAIRTHRLNVETVVGVSTDKACKPINVMGMTKALQERIFISANIRSEHTRFVCVRYGNVLASRGSVIPLFHEQIGNGGPVTITTTEMTRFLLPLDRAVDTVFEAIRNAQKGEVYVPKVPSSRIVDIAKILIDGSSIDIEVIGIRPGEKVHEILVSEEEAWHTVDRGGYYAIKPMLPELMTRIDDNEEILEKEYSSGDSLLSLEKTRDLLIKFNMMVNHELVEDGEFLR